MRRKEPSRPTASSRSAQTSRTDVIVLGGGIIGCSLAEELACRGSRVALIERQWLGAEASTAAAGILSAQVDLPRADAFFELCQASRSCYPAWVGRLTRQSGRLVGWRADGVLYLAFTAVQARRMASQIQWQQRRGLPASGLTLKQLRHLEPTVDGKVAAAFQFPTESQVDPVDLMRALAVTVRRAGVRLFEQTAVRRVLVTRRRVFGVETTRGRIHADAVVNCLGSWANLGGAFPVAVPVEPSRGQMLMLQSAYPLLRRILISERAYAVQRQDGRILIGSTIERAGFMKAVTGEGTHAILNGARRISRRIADCAVLGAWAGFRPRTPDDWPLLSATPIEGLYVATGHFRHGILLAPITAQVMADLVLTGRPRLDLSPFALSRFRQP